MFALPGRKLHGDLALEAVAAKHAARPPTVERTPVHMLEAGTHAAQSAELLSTFRSPIVILWM